MPTKLKTPRLFTLHYICIQAITHTYVLIVLNGQSARYEAIEMRSATDFQSYQKTQTDFLKSCYSCVYD